ncbi:MAG TPA: biopolymer transporter Tol [Pirellulales bacterium]
MSLDAASKWSEMRSRVLTRFAARAAACGVVALLSATGYAETPGETVAPSELESRSLSNITLVTDPAMFVKSGEGYFAPDGKSIVYQAQPKDYPFYQIYSQPLAGGPPRRISTGRGRTTCSYFTRDGEKIIFASSHLDSKMSETESAAIKEAEENAKAGRRPRYSWPFDPATDIFEADRDGHIVGQLTKEPGYDAEGAFSPDGKLIAFCSDRDGDPDLYVMNADGSNVRQLTNAPGYDGGPFISPDGRWVVFRSDRKEKDLLQIFVIGIDGKNETQLTDNVGVNWAPYWHPTLPYLIWTGADHSQLATNPGARPNYDLWLAKYEVVDGKFTMGKPVRLTDHASADVLPVFSPDGAKLMWTTGRSSDHTSQLWIADFKVPAGE